MRHAGLLAGPPAAGPGPCSGVVDRQPAEGPAARMASLDGAGHTGLTVAALRAQESARPDRLFADPAWCRNAVGQYPA